MRYQHPFVAVEHGAFTWCLHCERVWPTEDWVRNDWECPRPACDGGAADAWPWERWVEAYGYPEWPVAGSYWPQYPAEGWSCRDGSYVAPQTPPTIR